MNNYLPLRGGQMTEAAISRNVCTSELQINGGTGVYQGGSLIAYGNDVNELSGCFKIIASTNSSSVIALIGTPAGSLTWGGRNVAVIEEQGPGYIRYSNGFQICWGWQLATTTTDSTINFPKAFIRDAWHQVSVSVSGQSINIFALGWSEWRVQIANTNQGAITYTAVGYWK